MDTAKAFNPRLILLWKKVEEHPEAQRIISLFPSADIRVIKHQRMAPLVTVPAGKALLAGKRTLMIGQTTSFVGYFDGRLGDSIRCRPYYKLVPVSNGCPYYCTYCYLAYVYRKYSPYIKVNINYDTMFKQIRKTLAQTKGNVSFNMGEMLDSIALDHITGLTKMLVPFFAGLSRAFLMLLTKSSNVDNLLALEPNNQTVVSWSLNSQQIIETFEPGTASLSERVEAARLCQQKGYRIRLRIDPGILQPGWQASYAEMIHKALTVLEPENITLGMLRLMPGHFRLAQQAYGNRVVKLQYRNLTQRGSDNKLRYPAEQRAEFYSYIIDAIRSLNRNISISLCRETFDICNVFKDRCQLNKCNCVIW
jgi:spore photoproduct lyase